MTTLPHEELTNYHMNTIKLYLLIFISFCSEGHQWENQIPNVCYRSFTCYFCKYLFQCVYLIILFHIFRIYIRFTATSWNQLKMSLSWSHNPKTLPPKRWTRFTVTTRLKPLTVYVIYWSQCSCFVKYWLWLICQKMQ